MKSRIAQSLFFLALWLAMSFPLAPAVWAQTNAATKNPALAAADKEGCSRNLKIIYDAIQAYQADHKDLPNWLSDLVPQYIDDANILICPACQRSGQAENSKLSDPKMPSSYLFEFCPVPLGKAVAPGDPATTRREWKRRQMGLVGSLVPLVRCRHHPAVLNLAFNGKIYESPSSWEVLFTNQINLAALTPKRIFSGESKAGATAKIAIAPEVTFPPPVPQAEPRETNRAVVLAKSPAPASDPRTVWWLAGFLAVSLVISTVVRQLNQRLRRQYAQAALLAAKTETGASFSVSNAERIAIARPSGTAIGSSAITPYPHLEAGGQRQAQSQSSQPHADQSAQPANPLPDSVRAGVIANLSRWLRQKLVRQLVSDRAQLLATQHAAALQVLAVDERLSKIERQIRERNQEYEQRIDALLKELVTAKEENRELIQLQIAMLKAEMEKERLKAEQAAKEHRQN